MIYSPKNAQVDKQTIFEMSDGKSINNRTTGKRNPFQRKKNENLSTCSKVMAEHLYVYIYVQHRTL